MGVCPLSACSHSHGFLWVSYDMPKYEQTGTESIEAFVQVRPAVQFFMVKVEYLIPIDKRHPAGSISADALDRVSRRFFLGMLSVQRIGFRVFPCHNQMCEGRHRSPIPFGMPPSGTVCCVCHQNHNSGSVVTQGPPSVLLKAGTLFHFHGKSVCRRRQI